GGILMMLGHLSLAFDGLLFFYSGLALLIFGNGFFKPNISTLLGKLYSDRESLRDSAFTIFYMGINLGAGVCNLFAAFMRNKYGWGEAFQPPPERHVGEPEGDHSLVQDHPNTSRRRQP
ncbi:MAG: hypothetical protein EBY07_16465, partial [Actinobacteria bacterium]|nr:hypothetical protein [Actinomycetota bacterium]